MVRIVIFIDWFAPAYKGGGPIQSIVNLVNLPMEGVEYKVVCSNKDLGNELLTEVDFDTWTQFNHNTQVWYNSKNKSILSVLRNLAEWKPDLYFINGIYSVYYNLLPLLYGKANKKIISARGMLHPGALSQKSFKKKIYLKLWKALGFQHKYSFHATNSQEKEYISAVFGTQSKIHVAPNLPRYFETLSSPVKTKDSLRLVSIGLISPMKNYLEVLRALALCSERIEYRIYGPIKDSSYWRQCNEQIKQLPVNIQVSFEGDLPSNKVYDVLTSNHVFILPSKSENFGHALFEALTAGKPVITSHHTPWNFLAANKAGFNINVENISELAESISFFARADHETLAEWSEGAKSYSKMAIDTASIRELYKAMYVN
jgi:glycosyltransferase involved in cell wall biosynthesis